MGGGGLLHCLIGKTRQTLLLCFLPSSFYPFSCSLYTDIFFLMFTVSHSSLYEFIRYSTALYAGWMLIHIT